MHRSALGALIQRGISVHFLRDYLFSKGRNHATSVVITAQGRNHATSVVIPPQQGAESCNKCRDYPPAKERNHATVARKKTSTM